MAAAAAVTLLIACSAPPDATEPNAPAPEKPEERATQGEEAMAMEITSPAFQQGAHMPKRHTREGDDLSPALEWTNAPAGTQSFALICDDPDAPVGTWVHWVIWNIPADATALPEGIPADEALADGATQGANDFREIGYGGPMPPPGKAHRYYFKLYALDLKLDLAPGAAKKALLDAMEGHILAEAEVMGLYKR